MNFCILNLGCKVNRVESDAFAASLREWGWQATSVPKADVVIINTCTVTGEAEKKTRKAVRRALRENSFALVVVTGCAAVIDPKTYEEMDVRIIVEKDKAKVSDLVSHYFPGTSCEQTVEKNVTRTSDMLRMGDGFMTRVGIKIQDGCNNACTFCIVHRARGTAWSREPDSVIAEAKAYDEAGVKELVLTGINLGSYQADGYDLVGLLENLLNQTKYSRFRISSIEPTDVDERLIALLAEADGRICRHLHLPLQSGSDRILQEMARPYTMQNFLTLAASLYDAIPSVSLSTDVIVGFPSETEYDFEKTMQVARSCRFSKIHIFPYSKREGTPAALRSDQIPAALRSERVERLKQLALTLRHEDLMNRRGSEELVLVEKSGWGTTESYHHVPVPATGNSGEMLQIIL